MVQLFPGPAGRIEALVDNPGAACTTGRGEMASAPRATVVIAHPHPLHGGTMHTKVVFQVAKAFCRLGCAVVRFNFRGVGTSEGRFAEGLGEIEDYWSALEFASERYPGTELWAVGVSFGAWVAMCAGANDDRVANLVGIAPPVGLYDFSPVRDSGKPKFFVAGERDEVCSIRTLEAFYAHASEPKDLVVIDGADHLFSGQVTELADAVESLLG